MYCVNHPEQNASGVCVGCGKFFCIACLHEIQGKYHCKNCVNELFENQAKKIEHLKNKQQPMVFMNAGGASSSSSSSASVGGYPRRFNRSKGTSAILALFFGGLGIHNFYLGRTGRGILCLMFSWTFIPSIIGVIEFIVFLLMSQDSFDRKYNY